MRPLFAAVLASSIVACAHVDEPPVCSRAGAWTDGPYFEAARAHHRAELTAGDRVLLVGGRTNLHVEHTPGMELFDTAPGGTLATYSKAPRREGHTMTRLLDGRILILGGTEADDPFASQPTFLFDSVRDSWTFPSAPSPPPVYHTATLLDDGTVLLAGGRRNGFGVSPAEADSGIYDATRGTYRALPHLHHARADHTATRLRDGRVLVVGGWGASGRLADAELYDPATKRWTLVAGAHPRSDHSATLLRDGRVLLVGGAEDASTQLFDPRTMRFRDGPPLAPSRSHHTATLLDRGAVLITGGFVEGEGASSQVLLFDGGFCRLPSMRTPRYGHTATPLTNGNVIVAGGDAEVGVEPAMDPYVRATEIFRRSP